MASSELSCSCPKSRLDCCPVIAKLLASSDCRDEWPVLNRRGSVSDILPLAHLGQGRHHRADARGRRGQRTSSRPRSPMTESTSSSACSAIPETIRRVFKCTDEMVGSVPFVVGVSRCHFSPRSNRSGARSTLNDFETYRGAAMAMGERHRMFCGGTACSTTNQRSRSRSGNDVGVAGTVLAVVSATLPALDPLP